MRIARILQLGAATALLALAISGPASAQDVVVTDEASGLPCDIAPCDMQMHDDGGFVTGYHLLSGPEVIITTCQMEFDLTVDGSGNGEAYNQILAGSSCFYGPCGASGGTAGDGYHWPISMSESSVEGHEFALNIEICIGNRVCGLEIPFTEDELTHQYEFEGDGASGDGVTCDPLSPPPPTGVRAFEFRFPLLGEGTGVEVEHAEV